MAALTWTEAMSVGVPALDADHRCLVRLIGLLQGADDEQEAHRIIDIVLDTLVVYCRFHFSREEKVMAACSFPALSVHRGEHAGFAQFVARLREGSRAGGAAARARELLDYLSTWLCHHILIQDMAYKPYLINARSEEMSALERMKIDERALQMEGAA